MVKNRLVENIIQKTLSVPVIYYGNTPNEQAEIVSRQLDIALINVGFKASSDLLLHLSKLHKVDAIDMSEKVLTAISELVGNHVQHNTYFKEFPKNVPDTIEFWTGLINDTYSEDFAFLWTGNLLELDGYGKYRHTYQEMLAEHKPFHEKVKRKLKPINLGIDLQDEVNELYVSLGNSNVPLNEFDKDLLFKLARNATVDIGSHIQIRENKAIINAAFMEDGVAPYIDSVGDVLRLAAYLSDGDVTLATKTKYKSFTSKERRLLIKALISIKDERLNEVLKYKEQVKRLNGTIHGSKHPKIRGIIDIANGRTSLRTEDAILEAAFTTGDIELVVHILKSQPGKLLRNVNRLLLASKITELELVTKTIAEAAHKSPLRVLLSLRQYFENRNDQKYGRTFINKTGGVYTIDTNPIDLPEQTLQEIKTILDNVIEEKIKNSQIKVDSSILHYAIPISERDRAQGFNVVPRGTEIGLDKDIEILRLFTYWKQNQYSTDYDLSAVLLDENFVTLEHLSYTRISSTIGVHSGDITNAAKGASEFIDLELNKIKAKYIIPTVNIFSGETFTEVEESFFGFMLRDYSEKGKPFEPKTVETKSDLCGTNKVAVPLVFINTDDGWVVKQLNVFLKGYPQFNRVEGNTTHTSALVQNIVNNKYLTLEYLQEKVDLNEGEPDSDMLPDIRLINHTNLHEVIGE